MKILDKIRKLLSLAKSNNQHEASLAAERAQALMDEYSITQAQISQAERDASDPIDRDVTDWGGRYAATRHRWKRRLALAVARMNNCQVILESGTGKMMIVGRKSNREVAAYFIQYLCKTVERLAEEAWEVSPEKSTVEFYKEKFPWRSPTSTRSAKPEYIASFGEGATTEVLKRLEERRKRFEEQQQALVVAEMAPVKSWVNSNIRTKPIRGNGWQVGGTGIGAGASAGRNIALNDAVRGAVPNNRRLA